jgi:peptide/nickel transport system permease protein
MIGFIARRLVNYLFLSAIATMLGYVLVSMTLQPSARFLGKNPPIPQASIDAALDKMGVNPKVPLLERLWDWVTHLVTTGSLGVSTRGTQVTADIFERSGTSLRLLVIGTILGAVIGVALGVWGAVRQYRASDQIITYASFTILAMPVFVIGVVLMILATTLNQTAMHLLLPTITLTVGAVASYSRYQRSAMLDVMSADYIRTARSKGRTRGSAIIRHGVRVALIPMSTFFAYSFGLILTGASVTENVFSWHGMGEYLLTSVSNSDINAAAGTILFTSILVLIAGTLSDVIYAALDPRVRV